MHFCKVKRTERCKKFKIFNYFSIPFKHHLFSFSAAKSVCGFGDYCTKRINLLNMQNASYFSCGKWKGLAVSRKFKAQLCVMINDLPAGSCRTGQEA